MYSREFVGQVQQELQQFLPTATVLLGGSYQANEATSTSDLDLYIIAPTFKLEDTKYNVRRFRQRFPDKKIRLMVVPKLAYVLGVYFCSGITVSGEKQQSAFDRKTCVTNALKLALYYFLLARERGSEVLLKKSAQQAAIARVLANKQNTLPLSNNDLKERLAKEKKFSTIKVLLAAKVAGTKIESIQAVVALLAQELVSLVDVCAEYNGWNWRQYCLYNLKFIPKGEWLFCFENPGTMVINQLRKAIMEPVAWISLKSWAKRYVFPVIIF